MSADCTAWCLLLLSAVHIVTGRPGSTQRPCSYQVPPVEEVVTGVQLEPTAHARHRRQVFGGLRIKLYYDNASISNLTSSKRTFIQQTLLLDAVGYWQRALRVRQETAPIRLDRKCESNQFYVSTNGVRSCAGDCKPLTKCGEVDVPDSHLFQCTYCRTNNLSTCSSSGPGTGAGVADADFLLYVSAVHTERCDGHDTVAYAAHCQQEAVLDRPIAGHVNICPSSISTSPHDVEVLMSTVKHEILHALGFSAGLYAFYRDADTGQPLTERNEQGKPIELDRALGYYKWSTRTISMVQRSNWWTPGAGRIDNHTVEMFVTPRVVREARAHFGCEALEGAELENQGEMGTRTTHWEKRLFENEAMTGTHTQNPVYSRLTFALMEDTGWYKPNYELAEPLHWGSKLGCAFAQQSCARWIADKQKIGESPLPFCDRVKDAGDGTTQTTCTDTRDSLALCNLIKYARPLQSQYQNLLYVTGVERNQLTFYGGSVELADFCPYNQEFEWRDSTAARADGGHLSVSDGVTTDNSWPQVVHADPVRRDSRCEIESNVPVGIDNAALEEYGPSAMCFAHGHKWVQRKCGYKRAFRFYGAGCYTYTCNATDGLLYVHLHNNTASYACAAAEQLLTVRRVVDGWLHEGSIKCPSCASVCAPPFVCAPGGRSVHTSVGDRMINVPCAGVATATSYALILLSMYLLLNCGITFLTQV